MSSQAFLPGPLLLMGAPGVGKGTQAKELVTRWAIPQISTGDLLRANVAAATDAGRHAKQLMDAGILVPDPLVNQMVAERLMHPDTARGYILDGFPRTLAQAEWLDGKLDKTPAPSAKETAASTPALPLVAVSIRVEYTQLLRRITGRRICPQCGSIYNIYLQPPSREGLCDLDGTPLQRRDDDSEAVFEGRMRAYSAQTAPVVDHYRALGRLVDVDGEGPLDAVSTRVEAAVQQLRSSTNGKKEDAAWQ